jgi:hydroxymethylpyrimidine/phosphomethylpyrimidine kinase
MSLPIALTIAGSDSGGGAGVQADLKTFQALGVYGTCALTAVTAQNTLGVSAVHAVPADLVRRQIHAVLDDLPPAACKTGMLASAELVGVVAAVIRERALPNYVLDPVMVASSGDRLLAAEAENELRDQLLPLATVITPNLDEASLLAGFAVENETAMHEAVLALAARGARAVLLKGGHLQSSRIVDLFFDGTELRRWERERIETRSTHGTGCTLSAAITAGLAHGRPLIQAVDDALAYVRRALLAAPGIGAGYGPLHHLV